MELKRKILLKSLIILLITTQMGCRQDTSYGLKLVKDHYGSDYPYSYYLTKSELVVKSRMSFEQQFETREFIALEEKVKKRSEFLQVETFYLPIVQKVKIGRKNVLIFENFEDTSEGRIVRRLAIECDQLTHKLIFPKDCEGYLMVDTWEWPPAILDIEGGQIVLEVQDVLTGLLVGTLNIVVNDDFFLNQKVQIIGSFRIVDKCKNLFLSLPTRVR